MTISNRDETISIEDLYTIIDSKLKYSDFQLSKYLNLDTNSGAQRPDNDFFGSNDKNDVFNRVEIASQRKKKLLFIRQSLSSSNLLKVLNLLTADQFMRLTEDEISNEL